MKGYKVYLHLLVINYENEPYWEVFTSRSENVFSNEAIKRIKNVFKYEMGIDENDITEIIENCDWWINRIDKVENYKIELKKVK